jgi:hypothetical protein
MSPVVKERGFPGLILTLILCGALSRAAPLVDDGGRLLRQFPSEDGYLMLTISRNIALGLGMTTAAGTIPTNGTQPLVTLLWAFVFWMTGGDRTAGVAIALVLQLLIASLGAYCLYRLGQRLLVRRPQGSRIAALAAATWYATVLPVMHSMNCLETGTYALLVVVLVRAYLGSPGSDPTAPWPARRSILLGLLLGGTLWVRIDAVLLLAVACLARALITDGGRLRPTASSLVASLIMTVTATVVVSPWLMHNRLSFGSIMPISGTARLHRARFAESIGQVLVNLTEYVLVVLPVPERFEENSAVILASTLVLAGVGFLVLRAWGRSSPDMRLFLWLTAGFATTLSAYYGLFFGAGYFGSRYLFPASPLIAILCAIACLHGWRRSRLEQSRWASALAGFALIGLVTYPNLRLYQKGRDHLHFQVVEWVQANVPEEVWVGAPQSGTLGFFHDRTINLDGKVNPDALRAAMRNELPRYVVGMPIRFLVDWKGIARWSELPGIRSHFELIVDDDRRNLAVLKRKDEI